MQSSHSSTVNSRNELLWQKSMMFLLSTLSNKSFSEETEKILLYKILQMWTRLTASGDPQGPWVCSARLILGHHLTSECHRRITNSKPVNNCWVTTVNCFDKKSRTYDRVNCVKFISHAVITNVLSFVKTKSRDIRSQAGRCIFVMDKSLTDLSAGPSTFVGPYHRSKDILLYVWSVLLSNI